MYVKIIFIKVINNDRFPYNIKLQNSAHFDQFFDNITFKYKMFKFSC